MIVLTLLLCVCLGGASCQIKGREDPSCLGKNQGGAGQKGRTHLTFCAHTPHSLTSPSKDYSDSYKSPSCHIHYPLHFSVNFIHSKAVKCRENRSLQCLIMCVSAAEGARNQKEAFQKITLQNNADRFCTKHFICTVQPKEC